MANGELSPTEAASLGQLLSGIGKAIELVEIEKRMAAIKSLAETSPEAVAIAKRLARKSPKGGRLSLRDISASLAFQGFLNERGKRYNHKSIASMLGR